MPLNIWTRDEVPSLTLAGYSALGSGISSGVVGGVRDFASELARRKERDKREADEAKRERALAKMFKDDLGLSDAQIESLDAPTLKGMNEGLALQRSKTHQDVLNELNRTNMEATRQRTAIDRLREQQDLAATQVPSQILRQAGAGIPAPLSNEAFDEELARRTGMSPAALTVLRGFEGAGAAMPAGVLNELMQHGGVAGPLAFEEDPVSGSRFARSAKTVLPSGINPAKAISTEEVTLPSGEVVTVLRTGKATQTIRERPKRGEITPVDQLRSLTARYTALIGRRKYAEAQKVLDEILALGGSETDTAPNETPGKVKTLEKPTTKTEYDKLPSGTPYLDPNGVERVKR